MISLNCSQFGTAAIIGNLYGLSKLEYSYYEKNMNNTIGLTDEEYIDQVNKGIYKNFANDNIGFGLGQWKSNLSKEKLLNICNGMIEFLKCQLEFLVYDLSTNYQNLWEMLKKCTDLKNCTNQFLFLYGNSSNQTEEKQNEIILMLTILSTAFTKMW